MALQAGNRTGENRRSPAVQRNDRAVYRNETEIFQAANVRGEGAGVAGEQVYGAAAAAVTNGAPVNEPARECACRREERARGGAERAVVVKQFRKRKK